MAELIFDPDGDWSAHVILHDPLDKQFVLIMQSTPRPRGVKNLWKYAGGTKRDEEEVFELIQAGDTTNPTVDESPIVTAIRETFEETGVVIVESDLIFRFSEQVEKPSHTKFIFSYLMNDISAHNERGSKPDFEFVKVFNLEDLKNMEDLLPRHLDYFEYAGFLPSH